MFQMWSLCATSTSAHLDGDRTWHDPPGKISNALCAQSCCCLLCVGAVLSPTSYVLRPAQQRATVAQAAQGKRTTHRLCPARFVPPQSCSSVSAGAAVLCPHGCSVGKTDPPASPCPARRPNPSRPMVCAQTHTPPSPLASRAPATSFPLYALLALLPGDSQSGNPQPMACHCLLGCGLACRRSPMGTAL